MNMTRMRTELDDELDYPKKQSIVQDRTGIGVVCLSQQCFKLPDNHRGLLLQYRTSTVGQKKHVQHLKLTDLTFIYSHTCGVSLFVSAGAVAASCCVLLLPSVLHLLGIT